MAKKGSEEVDEIVEDVNIFPEGHVMHQWSQEMDDRDHVVVAERTRPGRRNLMKNKGQYYVPREWWPAGYQIAWISEYLMNKPEIANLESRIRDGWEFVKASEMPEYRVIKMDHEFDRGREDGRIRNGAHIMMKLPLDEYIESQEELRMEGEEVRRQSAALTSYMSNQAQPRQVIENSVSYTPSYKHKGR